MTASPMLGKGASVNGLESLLRAKVYSVQGKEELERFVTSPKVSVYYYATAVDGTSSPLVYYSKLEDIKFQCVSTLVENISDTDSLKSSKKMLQKVHTNLCFCIEKLGVRGALQAAHILLKGNCLVRNEVMEMEGQSSHVDYICDKYLSKAAIMLASDLKDQTKELNSLEVLQEPFFSKKLLRLIDILSNFGSQQNKKCVIFVNGILTARSLSSILQSLQVLSAWKCDFLLGFLSGLKCVSQKSTNALLAKFRSGELNLLVATKVAEEGLDIQTCCLVVRFDLPENVASFIESRGCAQMPQSEYAFLVGRGNEKEQNLLNLLRKKGNLESREKEKHFVELPPEICGLKIVGFSKDIGSSLSLLPSVMHHLESLPVAVELKHVLSVSLPEGAEVSASRALEALPTEKCNEHFSLERLKVLGDALLKFAVGSRLFLLHDALDEGQLTRKRSSVVNNTNLLKLATVNRLQVYIRDQSFYPCQFYASGRPCSVVCSAETEKNIHTSHCSRVKNSDLELRCTKSHHLLHKKTIADVVESLVGPIILDSSFKDATAFLNWTGVLVEFEDVKVSHICSASSIYLSLAAQIDIAVLEAFIGYQYNNKGLLVQLFFHLSYSYHSGGCYQRLEFLGDAVLDYLITFYLYSVYPMLKPSQLTDLTSTCVNNICFANFAINRSFYKYISESSGLCKSMEKYVEFSRTPQLNGNAVEAPACPKALGDLVQSCIGAILLGTGFNLSHVRKAMSSFPDPVIKFSRLQLNPIRELPELSQSYNMELEFASSKKDNTYIVEVKVKGKDVSGYSSASNFSKKAAKRRAAKQVILMLKEHGYKPKSKSLEEVLKSPDKMEANLIGYDESAADVSAPYATIGYNETPTDVSAPYATGLDNLKVQDSCRSGASPSKVHPLGVEPHKSGGTKMKPISQMSSLNDTSEKDNDSCTSDSQTPGCLMKKSAKSLLFEICAANGWSRPVFECCKETGPSHLKEFTYRVIVKPDCLKNGFIDVIGNPAGKKKEAAESAAEGAVWYLKLCC